MTKPAKPEAVEVEYNETYDKFGIAQHFHNSHEIILVTEGKAQYTINNCKYIAEKNSVVLISNLEMHEVEILEYPYKRYFALIAPDYFQSVMNNPVLVSIFKHRPNSFRHVIGLSAEECFFFEDLLRTMHGEISRKQDMWQSALDSYVHLFIILLYRCRKSAFPMAVANDSTNMVLEIQKYIEEHYMEEVSLNNISKLFFMDMYYLSHLFKDVTGFNFKEYLILCRLAKAKELLFYTNSSITQVSLDSGFSNVNHFIRTFKKYEATTPRRYRMKFR